jgi:protein TonB
VVYPKEAIDAGIEGKVFVEFYIEKDGTVSDAKVLRGIGYGCDEEALRVVGLMPKWFPGKQRGQAVRVRYTLPINFKLQ